MWNMARAIANEGLALLIAHYNYTLRFVVVGSPEGLVWLLDASKP